MRLATMLALALVVALTTAIIIKEKSVDCRPFTIGRSAIGSCDWLGALPAAGIDGLTSNS